MTGLRKIERDELSALAKSNDALGKPSAIHKSYLSGERPNYQEMADAGLVKIYARAPKGWGSKNYFGVRITKAGRAAIADGAIK